MLQIVTVNIFLTVINEKSTFLHNQPFSTQTCDSCLICLCVMLASLRKGSPFIHRNHIAASQVQPLCRIDHISWPSLQASSCFPDISLPTSFQFLLFSGCLFHRKKTGNFQPNVRLFYVGISSRILGFQFASRLLQCVPRKLYSLFFSSRRNSRCNFPLHFPGYSMVSISQT